MQDPTEPPNSASEMEPAEGSRETVEQSGGAGTADRQEQIVQRSPGAPDPNQSAVDEHAVTTTTQSAGGLGSGSPDRGPKETPERRALEEERERTRSRS